MVCMYSKRGERKFSGVVKNLFMANTSCATLLPCQYLQKTIVATGGEGILLEQEAHHNYNADVVM